MPEAAVAAPAAEVVIPAAAPPANPEGSVTSRLAQFFAESDGSQVDNSTPTDEAPEPAKVDDSPPVEVPTDDNPAEAKPDAATDDKTGDDAKAEETPADAGDDEDADFKAVSKDATPKEYLTDVEAVKAKFPRNSSNEIVAAFAEVSQEAKAGSELRTKLGGEHFIEPLTKISQSLQTGEMQNLFTGIVEAASSEALLSVLGQAVYMGFVQGPTWAENPETAVFGKALTGIMDEALKERFGPTATVDKLAKMAQWDSLGWFDHLEKWTADNYVPQDELNTLLEMSNDPKYAALVKRAVDAEAKLEEKATQDKSVATIENGKIDSSFGAEVDTEIGKILKDVVWAKSILRDIESDTPEMKAEKAFFRSRLQADAIEQFTKVSDAEGKNARAKLLEAYKQGRQHTATYKKDLADAINDAILATQEPTTTAQRMLAKIYGKQRNTKLPATPTNGDTPPTEKLTPTIPQDAPTTGIVKSRAETIKGFDDFFKSNAASG